MKAKNNIHAHFPKKSQAFDAWLGIFFCAMNRPYPPNPADRKPHQSLLDLLLSAGKSMALT
jgi:hypothetical protein